MDDLEYSCGKINLILFKVVQVVLGFNVTPTAQGHLRMRQNREGWLSTGGSPKVLQVRLLTLKTKRLTAEKCHGVSTLLFLAVHTELRLLLPFYLECVVVLQRGYGIKL